MIVSVLMIACLIGHIGIAVLVMLYVKVNQKGIPGIEKAKLVNTAKNWTLGVLTNLAAGLLLLLFEKLIG